MCALRILGPGSVPNRDVCFAKGTFKEIVLKSVSRGGHIEESGPGGARGKTVTKGIKSNLNKLNEFESISMSQPI